MAGGGSSDGDIEVIENALDAIRGLVWRFESNQPPEPSEPIAPLHANTLARHLQACLRLPALQKAGQRKPPDDVWAYTESLLQEMDVQLDDPDPRPTLTWGQFLVYGPHLRVQLERLSERLSGTHQAVVKSAMITVRLPRRSAQCKTDRDLS
jgi:hypothetical protein